MENKMIPYCFCPKCGDVWGFSCIDGKWTFHTCDCFKSSESIDESKVREALCIPEFGYGFQTKKGLAKTITRIAKSFLYTDEDCSAGNLVRNAQRIYNYALSFSGYGTKTLNSLMTDIAIKELKEKEEIEDKYEYVDYVDSSNYKEYIGKKINVRKYVDFSYQDIDSIPITFGKVNGDFYCECNRLTSLINCPKYIGGNFYCNDNSLTSLNGCPIEVGGDFLFHRNKITSLEGCPRYVGRDFCCYENPISSLEGCTLHIGRDFYCAFNKLESLDGCPKYVGRYFTISKYKSITDKDISRVCEVGGKIYIME